MTAATWNSQYDIFSATLVVALALHALVIFGVTFDIDRGELPAPERTLDVTLVKPALKPKEPEEADFLAQTSQEGGAEIVSEDRPTAPLSPPAVIPKERPAVESEKTGTPVVEPLPQKQIVHRERKTPTARVSRQTKPKEEALPRPNITDILASTQQEIDRLTAEIDRISVNSARKPKRKAINASTQEYKYAAYLEAWRKKVERIGNLNYPDEAKRKRLHGNLVLHVALRPDGSVLKIRVVRSSGHKVLDDAAVRIVKLAAPYSPFPKAIREEVDILDITRSWQFMSSNRLFTDG